MGAGGSTHPQHSPSSADLSLPKPTAAGSAKSRPQRSKALEELGRVRAERVKAEREEVRGKADASARRR